MQPGVESHYHHGLETTEMPMWLSRLFLGISWFSLIVFLTVLLYSSSAAQSPGGDFAHLRELCLLDNGEACAQLANRLLKLPNPEKFFSEAANAYDKACALEVVWACNNIADQFYYGKFGRTQDLVKAIGYFELGCKRKNEYACSRLFEIMGNTKRK